MLLNNNNNNNNNKENKFLIRWFVGNSYKPILKSDMCHLSY